MQKFTICLFSILLLSVSALKTTAQLIPYNQKGKWGFASTEGKISIPCIYDEVAFFSDDNFAKVKKNGKYGFIKSSGQTIIPFTYDIAHRLYDVHHGEYSMGILYNPEIHLNRDFDYDEIKSNRYILSRNGQFGVLRVEGDTLVVLIPFRFSKISFDPAKKIFHCQQDDDMVYYSTKGLKLSEEQVAAVKEEMYAMADMGPSRPAPLLISRDGKWGVVRPDYYDNRKKDSIVPPVYDEIEPKEFNSDFNPVYDLFAARKGEKWGMLNGAGKVILPFEYDSIQYRLSFRRQWLPLQFVFVVKQKGKWGVLGKKDDNDNKLTTHLPFQYRSISNVYGHLLVKKTDQWQIYDTKKYAFINKNSYKTVTHYEHNSVNGFYLFQVKNKLGQTVFVGQNGVEFFTD